MIEGVKGLFTEVSPRSELDDYLVWMQDRLPSAVLTDDIQNTFLLYSTVLCWSLTPINALGNEKRLYDLTKKTIIS